MVCQHLRDLYDLCEKNQLRLAGPDLIRIVCRQCNLEETCPSVFSDEYDSEYHKHDEARTNRPIEDTYKVAKSV